MYYKVAAVRERGVPLTSYSRKTYPVGRFCNRLVAICDRMIFELAVDVTKPEQYQEFYRQYYAGYLLSFDLYDFSPREGDISTR